MIPEENTLAEIVRKFPPAAALFEKYDLDYCCRGNQSLREACPEEETFRKVEHALHRMLETDPADSNTVATEHMNVAQLAAYIVERHHAYVKESMPLIYAHLKKVSDKHGNRHPFMRDVFRLFSEVKEEMEQHMMKEEHILFPAIAGLASADPAPASRRMLEGPIRMMMHEHDNAGSHLHAIRTCTGHYQPPADACTTFRLSFDELKQFEYDLHKHVHLENNVLFPKALALCDTLASQPSA